MSSGVGAVKPLVFVEVPVPQDRVLDVYRLLGGAVEASAATGNDFAVAELQRVQQELRDLKDGVQNDVVRQELLEAVRELRVVNEELMSSLDAAQVENRQLKSQLEEFAVSKPHAQADPEPKDNQKEQERLRKAIEEAHRPKKEEPETAPKAESPKPASTKAVASRAKAKSEYEKRLATVMTAAEEVGIFNATKLAEHMEINPQTVGGWIRVLVERKELTRHGGNRGPGVFFTHPSYKGELRSQLGRPAGVLEKMRQVGKDTAAKKLAKKSGPVVTKQTEPREPKQATEPTEDEKAAPGVPSLEAVRDIVVKYKPGEEFQASQVLKDFGEKARHYKTVGIETRLHQLVKKGTLEDLSPTPDMALFAYVKPTASGPKATGKDKDDKTKSYGGNSGPSGRGPKANNSAVQALLNACVKVVGRENVKKAGNGHWEVTNPANRQRVLISSTPKNDRSVQNDRTRLKRAGLALA